MTNPPISWIDFTEKFKVVEKGFAKCDILDIMFILGREGHRDNEKEIISEWANEWKNRMREWVSEKCRCFKVQMCCFRFKRARLQLLTFWCTRPGVEKHVPLAILQITGCPSIKKVNQQNEYILITAILILSLYCLP